VPTTRANLPCGCESLPALLVDKPHTGPHFAVSLFGVSWPASRRWRSIRPPSLCRRIVGGGRACLGLFVLSLFVFGRYVFGLFNIGDLGVGLAGCGGPRCGPSLGGIRDGQELGICRGILEVALPVVQHQGV